MQDSLLWVYEGQTQYWGEVLAARSGLWTRQQALDQLALTAAYYDIETGAQWRPLQDTTNDPIINPRRPMSWRDWQRFEDYYAEGMLIWLDVDTLIRERSHGKRSLDDFAKAFFGIDDGSTTTVTYTFDDVVAALNAVEPYDWAGFLRDRLDGTGRPAPLDGLRRGGYRLVYDSTPSEFESNRDEGRKRLNLTFSVGLELENNGAVITSIWDSPAFKAGLTEGGQVLAVNGVAYSNDLLKDAIRAAVTDHDPIQLIVKNADRYQVVNLDYHAGLRYPHLERDPARRGAPGSLDAILAPNT
jgi:predicted metalloprotease with PDZ domain